MLRISVCMATYNGGGFIEQQLRSIIGQLSLEDEVIISDDGSTDNTLVLIQNFNDPRVKVFHHHPRGSIADNFENALKKAGGRYVFFADQDDIWEKNKVATLLPLLRRFDLVVSDCRIIDARGNVVSESYFKIRRSGTGLIKNLMHNTYMGCCMAFRNHILYRSLPFPENIPMQDWWMGLVAECTGSTFFCETKLVRYRHHGGNASRTALGKSSYPPKNKIYFRLHLAMSLLGVWWSNFKMNE